MKKLRFLALSLVAMSATMFTSCEDDTTTPLGPALTVTETGSATVSNNELVIQQGASLTFAIDARKGDADLDLLRVEVSGANTVSSIPDTKGGVSFTSGVYEFPGTNDNNFRDTLMFANAGLNTGLTEYTFTVEDNDGEVTVESITVRVEPATTPLSADQSFTWQRVGGAAGTGLSQFGLAWTANSSQSAIVKTDAATRFVQLDAGDYQAITTEQELSAAIAAATEITDYRGVSATQSQSNINDVLAVSHNGENYILLVQSSTVTSGTQGTTIKIDGNYKN